MNVSRRVSFERASASNNDFSFTSNTNNDSVQHSEEKLKALIASNTSDIVSEVSQRLQKQSEIVEKVR